MTIFIAGAGGYIGPKMVQYFLAKGHEVIAMDRFYFGSTLDSFRKNRKFKIVKDDIRTVDKKHLKDVDVVINLASISNDPASELDHTITQSINYKGAVRLARIAKEMKVPLHIFTSSCSVYGAGHGTLTETSATAPISEYAKSKINAEADVMKLADKNFSVAIVRLATVYGLSEKRMRFDLIINLMTLHAWKNKKIFILGGGKQWRPLIHIADCIKAFDLLIDEKSKTKVNKQVYNVGSNQQNFQVFQVANHFKKHFPAVSIEIAPDDPDQRSYHVSFDKIHTILGFETEKSIDDGIEEIKDALDKGIITDESTRTHTLRHYQYLLEADKILSAVKLKNKLF